MCHNYFKDWKHAKLLCDKRYVVEQMNEWFTSIEDQWPDIEAYRNEIISHAFGRGQTKNVSIFSLGTWVFYQIPLDRIDIIHISGHIKNMTAFLRSHYPEYWKEFEDGSFPPFPYTAGA